MNFGPADLGTVCHEAPNPTLNRPRASLTKEEREKTTRNTALATVLAGTLATTAAWAENVTIEVGYPYSSRFDVTFERIMPLFKEAHPDIDVKFRATYDNYEDGTNTVLREAVADKLPDITFQGLNRQAILVEKGIAQSLEPLIAKEPDFSKEGYHQAMLGLGTFGGQVYGLPFAVSLPVGYYNMDALNTAGITTLPQTWDEVVANCEKLRAAGYKNPLFWGWNITGNWFLQALLRQAAAIFRSTSRYSPASPDRRSSTASNTWKGYSTAYPNTCSASCTCAAAIRARWT